MADSLTSQLLAQTTPRYPNTSIKAADPSAADKAVMDKRYKDLTKVTEQTKDLSWWNPFGYLTGGWKAKQAVAAYNAPITDEERQLAQADIMKPLIEREVAEKYDPAIKAREQLITSLAQTLPPINVSDLGKGPTGQGTVLTAKERTRQSPAQEEIMRLSRENTSLQKAKTQEAEQLADDIVVDNLRTVVKRPYEVGGVRPGRVASKALEGLTLGVLGADKRDPRVIKAESLQFPKSKTQDVLEGAATLASLFIPYAGLEYGAVKIGTALRSVRAVNTFYEAYPYLARTAVANLGVAAGDGLIRTASGQDYTAKDFFLNIAMQGVFDKALGTQKARILSHLDNESRVLAKNLGRTARPDEIFEHMAERIVPGTDFTYGNLFAEQRHSFLKGGDFLSAVPNPTAERRLAYYSGGRDAMRLPEGGMPLPEANKIPLDQVQTDPARFQFRENIDPTRGFQEQNVQGILDQGFDPKQVRPLEIGRFPGPDGKPQEMLLNGHNTLEVLRRQGVPEAERRIIEFASEKEAIAYARKANLVTKMPEVLQKVRIAQALEQEGKNVEQIALEMGRVKPSEARRYLDIGGLDPTIQRQVSQGVLDENLAGILGKYTKSYGFDSGLQEQIVQKIQQDRFTPARLSNYLDALSSSASKTKQEMTLFGVADIPQGFDEIERVVSEKKAALSSLQKKFAAAGSLPEGQLNARQKGSFRRQEKDLKDQVKALDYLLSTGGRAELETLPKDINPTVFSKVRKEIFDATPTVDENIGAIRQEAMRREGALIRPEEIPGIRLEKMSTDGAKETLRNVMYSNPDLLTARTRGVVSDAAAVEAANEIGITKQGLLNLPVGTTMTKEQLTAARMLVSAHGEDVAKLAKMAAMEAIGSETTAVQKEYMRAIVEHAQLQGVIRGFAAEAGRGLQSFKMNVSPLERLQGRFFDILQTADKNQTEALTRMAARIDINDPDQVLAFIRKNTRRGYLDMVSEFLTAIKLTSPTTHVVNATSNSIYNLAVPLFRLPVGAVDALRSAVTGTARERYASEALYDLKGMFGKGAKEAFNIPAGDIANYLKTKYKPFSSPKSGEAEAYLASIKGGLGQTWKALADEMYLPGGNVEDMIGRVPAIKGSTGNKYIDTAIDAAGKTVRLPFRLLNASDIAVRTMANAGEMYSLAARNAFKEGLSGEAAVKRMYELLENPTGEMLETAAKNAEMRVFQQPMGPLAQQVNRIRGLPVVGPLVRAFILPFVKTPANLIKMGYRPFNPAELVRGIKAGGGEASEAITRSALGAMTALGLTMFALDGTITGADPQDLKLRDELYAQGWQKNSIRIGDRYYAYDRIEPLQQSVKIAAAIADAYRKTGVVNVDMVNAAAMDIATGTLDRSYIRGMNDLLNAAFNPDRYGESWLKQYIVSQPIPAFVRTINTLTDTDEQGRPVVRDPENLTEYAKSQIPGLAPGLKPKLDSFGRPIVRKTGAIEAVFSPVRSTQASITKQEVEQMRSDFEALKKLSAADREASAEAKHQAMLYIADLAELPLEARVQNLTQLQKDNPDMAKRVTDMLKNRENNYTFRDETLSAATVKARAAAMLQYLKDMPAEFRPAQYQDWKNKKIMTDATEKELKRLMSSSSTPTP